MSAPVALEIRSSSPMPGMIRSWPRDVLGGVFSVFEREQDQHRRAPESVRHCGAGAIAGARRRRRRRPPRDSAEPLAGDGATPNGRLGFLVDDEIEVTTACGPDIRRRQSGQPMPPSDRPTTCARRNPERIEQADASAAGSGAVYATGGAWRRRARDGWRANPARPPDPYGSTRRVSTVVSDHAEPRATSARVSIFAAVAQSRADRERGATLRRSAIRHP